MNRNAIYGLDSDLPTIDLDAGNPFFSENRARMSFGELVAECEKNYERVANLAAGLSDEELGRKPPLPLPMAPV